MASTSQRHIEIDFVGNLRDLGGYKTRDGRQVAWRRLFRGGELRHASLSQVLQLRDEIGLNTVLDLRGLMEIRPERVAFLKSVEISYHNISLEGEEGSAAPEGDLFNRFSNMGEFYLWMLRSDGFNRQLIRALELVADPTHHPILFHCAVGKDRTGILAAFILGILGVSDEDIIADYALTEQSMPALIERLKADERTVSMVTDLPAYFWQAAPESMETMLVTINQEYGSIREYLTSHGVNHGLFTRMEEALLE